jgi:hypothetical protein
MKTKSKTTKSKKQEDDSSVLDIVNEQRRRIDMQSKGLPSQTRPNNDAPFISNGEREAQAMQASQQGFYNLPADMLPNSKDED